METNARRNWDVVDQASLESFPASDPPGWGSYRAAPSAASIAETIVSAEPIPSAAPRASLTKRFVIGASMVVSAIAGWQFIRGRVKRHRRRVHV